MLEHLVSGLQDKGIVFYMQINKLHILHCALLYIVYVVMYALSTFKDTWRIPHRDVHCAEMKQREWFSMLHTHSFCLTV